ncbi:tetratricopeptide repeat protein [Actinospica sp. MGRD01-02]|uniref:Tetratricopeptide repeat protein n=1 Tax=Actinospica acidithermotolerans TaxID=2828514 RepID=A0A941EGU8_9ACTN|nr:tetratricopeptide repeat protein [Actinospica acidithermotolerans]MBR7830395.1 tetratricopeptide repeat protein [Actinospica acidithermotolerans]
MRPSFSTAGVVDLSALKKPAAQPGTAASAAAGGSSAHVFHATEADFETSVIQRSAQVPVVLELFAEQYEPSAQLGAILEKLAEEFGGRFVLARVDVDANPQLAQAMRVQQIPAVKIVIQGQLIGEFDGVRPEAEIRQLLTDLVALAEREFGMTGPADAAPLPAPPLDPLLAAAYEALEADDLDGAARALQNLLADQPAHPEAKVMLSQVELMRRTAAVDPDAVLAAAKDAPDDVEAQCSAADVLMASGHQEEAFALLLDAVRRFTGAEKDRARLLLIEYFELLGTEHPAVPKARQRLAALLF